MDLTRVLIKALITEKSMQDASLGWYTFAVSTKSNKGEIKKAVEDQFKVNVRSVKTLVMKGKSKRVGRKRQEAEASPWKKALVKLAPEQKIDLFEVGK